MLPTLDILADAPPLAGDHLVETVVHLLTLADPADCRFLAAPRRFGAAPRVEVVIGGVTFVMSAAQAATAATRLLDLRRQGHLPGATALAIRLRAAASDARRTEAR